MADDVVDAGTRAEIEALVVEYAWCVDHREPERLADLLDEDVVLEGVDAAPLDGRDAVMAWVASKVGGPPTRHLLSNLRLSGTREAEVEGWVSQAFYAAAPGRPATVPLYVGEYHDRYVRVQGRWRFSSRTLARTLVAPEVADG